MSCNSSNEFASRKTVLWHHPVRTTDAIPCLSKVRNLEGRPLDVQTGIEEVQFHDLNKNQRRFTTM